MTKTEVERLDTLAAKLHGPPRKGRHVGGGIHAPMTDDPASPGWSHGGVSFYERVGRPGKADEPGVYDAPGAAKLSTDAGALTAAERTELDAVVTKAAA